jgi:hypothetical protein|tara:strand:+ start:166 stop:594 length:429 start_codon:yes stop_codon:yes gene_type:complete
MIKFLSKKIFNFVILLLLIIQIFFYVYNKKPSFDNFSQKNVTVENFSSIVLGKSGITKIGSEKLNKIDNENIYLEGNSYLENKEYKIYGKNISIKLKEEISISNEPVKVINSMGTLNAKGFKNLDYEGKIIFEGEIEFVINK